MFYKFFRFWKFYRVQFRKTYTPFVVMVVMYGNTQALSMFSLFDIWCWCSRPCITPLYLSQIPSLAYGNWVLLILKVTSLCLDHYYCMVHCVEHHAVQEGVIHHVSIYVVNVLIHVSLPQQEPLLKMGNQSQWLNCK